MLASAERVEHGESAEPDSLNPGGLDALTAGPDCPRAGTGRTSARTPGATMASKEIFTRGPKQPWGVHESYRGPMRTLKLELKP